MSAKNRNLITEKIEVYGLSWTKMKDVYEILKKAEQEAKDKGLTDIRFDYRSFDDYGSPATEFFIQGERPENDKEIAIRLANESKAAEYRKLQYESLKKEFEGK